jgi:hypothetical protein
MERHQDLPGSEEQKTMLPTLEAVMRDFDDFLATTLARQIQAEEVLHNGDPGPRLAMWSTQDPVTVLGALQTASGWDEVSRLFGWLGSGFSDRSGLCPRLVPDLLPLVRLRLRLSSGRRRSDRDHAGTCYGWRQHAKLGSLMRQVGDRADAAAVGCGLLLAAAAGCVKAAARRSAL